MENTHKKLGIYVHVPYCIQRCSYCDFATYEQSKILPPADYFRILKKEIHTYSHLVAPRKLDTLYFGGGTPSLVPAEYIVSVIEELSKAGLQTGPNTEITLEINPATLSSEKMKMYLSSGVNRFSVGAQTFDDALLKSVNREHDAFATRETLEFLAGHNCNFTFDILFALPGQKMAGLARDLEITKAFRPKHISAYCLTVPEGHPLSFGRPPEDEQMEMFSLIQSELGELGLKRYEISNFSLPGHESQHNLLYWTDHEYLSFGLSAHSYLKDQSWGVRFWNPSKINDYVSWVSSLASDPKPSRPEHGRSDEHFELILKHQSLTDFLHTSLRMMRGIIMQEVGDKFGQEVEKLVARSCSQIESEGLLTATSQGWALSEKGILLSNLVFSKLTYLAGEV